MKIRTVAVCGSNVMMSSIRASLHKRQEFQVEEFEGFFPDVLRKLDEAPPDAILFDLTAVLPDFAISLLSRHPNVMLIGVDLLNNKMLLLSGEQSRCLTTDDLAEVMKGDDCPGVGR